MRNRRRWWLVASFLSGLLAVGFRYWTTPYERVSLPDSLVGPGLVVVVCAALLVSASGLAGIRTATLLAGSSIVAVVAVRVIVDVGRDSTSHNLWPIELVIAAALGSACALIGAMTGHLIGRFLGPSLRLDDRSS